MSVRINKAGRQHARHLVSENHYVKDSDWSEAKPSPEEENDFLDKHGWDEFAKWYLAEDTSENEETKGRYKFPYGDFKRVHRSGLIAAKQRAGEWDYDDVEKLADDLLDDVPQP